MCVVVFLCLMVCLPNTGLNSPPPLSLTVTVAEVECVREGCQSEALKRLSGSVQERQCFTVVFRGARKSLDLVCPSEAEAQCWVRGLRALKEYVANMTQKEKLDQYPAQTQVQENKYSTTEATLVRSTTAM